MENMKSVPAIEKAIAILDYLEDKYEGATLSEISTSLGLAKSTTHGILKTLTKFNLLTLKGNDSRFVLGPKFLSYAFSAEKSLDIIQVAYPYMVELRDQINETVKISVKNKNLAVVISKIEAQKEYHATSRIGAQFPLHAGAAGKVLLAYSPTSEIEHYLESNLEKYTDYTIVDPALLRKELQEVVKKGFAEDRGERFPNVRALACPLFDYKKEVVAAISVPYLATPDEEAEKQRVLTSLIEFAQKISEALGYRY